jgi:hypothetical protein
MRKFQQITFLLILPIYVIEAKIEKHSLQSELESILLEHKIRATKIFQDSTQNVSESSNFYPIRHNLDSVRFRRDMPSIHMKKGKKKLRTCQNMNGILGTSSVYSDFSLSLSLSFFLYLFIYFLIIHSFFLSFC